MKKVKLFKKQQDIYGSKALKEPAKQDVETIKMVKATKCMMMKQEIQNCAYTVHGTTCAQFKPRICTFLI